MLDAPISRRALLKAGGALVVTFALAPRAPTRSAATPAPRASPPTRSAASSRSTASGQVTLYSGKVELGTGALTAITQIAAEELSVPFARVTTIQGDTVLTPGPGADLRQPVGPERRHADPARGGDRARGLARAGGRPARRRARPSSRCATASSRRATAARRCPTPSCSAGGSCTIKVEPGGAAEGSEGLHDRRQAGAAARHSGEDLRHVRLRAGRQACRACCTPGWSIRPASRRRCESFNDAACRKIPGYVRAVRKGDFLAVVATNEWAAIRASTTIVAKWSDWAGLPDESQLFEYVRNSKIDRNEVLQSTGDSTAAHEGGRPDAAGDLRPRDEHARLDRPVVRGRRVQERPPDGLDAVAGEPPAARATRDDAADSSRRTCAASTSRARAAMAATAPTTARRRRR